MQGGAKGATVQAPSPSSLIFLHLNDITIFLKKGLHTHGEVPVFAISFCKLAENAPVLYSMSIDN